MKGISNKICNLHVHSNRSDGDLTPEDILKEAEKQGVEYLAIADHDILPDYRTYELAKNYNIKLIPSLELGCVDKEFGKIHILAYFEKPEILHSKDKAEKIKEADLFLKRSREGLNDRIKIAVERINNYIEKNKDAFPFVKKKLTLEDVKYSAALKKRGGKIPEGYDIKNEEVESRDLAGPLVELGYFKNEQEAYLFFKQNNQLNLIPNYSELCWYKPSVEDVIKLAKGLEATQIVLAHPGEYIKKSEDCKKIDILIEKLINLGLTGIETISKHNNKEVRQHYSELADRFGLVKTKGGDNHTAEEIKNLCLN